MHRVKQRCHWMLDPRLCLQAHPDNHVPSTPHLPRRPPPLSLFSFLFFPCLPPRVSHCYCSHRCLLPQDRAQRLDTRLHAAAASSEVCTIEAIHSQTQAHNAMVSICLPFPSLPFLSFSSTKAASFISLPCIYAPTCRSTPTQQASDSEAHGAADAAALSRQVEELKLNLSAALRELDDTRAALQTHRNQQQQQQQQRQQQQQQQQQQHGMVLGGLSGSERSQQREALTGASMDGAGASRCELCFAVLLLLFAESVLFPCCEREGKGGSVLC